MKTILLALALVFAATGQPTLNTPDIVTKISPAVVLIKGEGASGASLGSGLIVAPDGKIATNLHVIRDLRIAGVQLANGEVFDTITVLAFDERKDLAVIKIAGFDLPVVELGNSNELRVGERVIAIGSPRGLQGTITTGVVSAIRDDPSGGGFKVIQTDAAVNPGNSGGPLLNSLGQAVGVVTAKIKGSEGLNFAVPINYVRGMLNDLRKPMSLEELRGSLNATKGDVFRSTGYPSLWKSLASGKVRRLRFESDFIYGETVLSEEQRRIRFDSYELKKHEKGYKGVVRVGFTCTFPSAWDRSPIRNQCRFEMPIEFISVTLTRIEGRGFGPPEGAKLDCKRCTYSRPSVWTLFTWIPE